MVLACSRSEERTPIVEETEALDFFFSKYTFPAYASLLEKNPFSKKFILKLEGETIGLALFYKESLKTYRLLSVYISELHRSKGCAKQLLGESVARLTDAGADQIVAVFMDTLNNKAPLVKLLEYAGFDKPLLHQTIFTVSSSLVAASRWGNLFERFKNVPYKVVSFGDGKAFWDGLYTKAKDDKKVLASFDPANFKALNGNPYSFMLFYKGELAGWCLTDEVDGVFFVRSVYAFDAFKKSGALTYLLAFLIADMLKMDREFKVTFAVEAENEAMREYLQKSFESDTVLKKESFIACVSR